MENSKKNQAVQVSNSYWIKVVAIFFVGWILMYATRTIFNPVMGVIGEQFGLSNTQLGLANSIFFLTYAVAQIPFGMIGDKIGRKLVIAVGFIVLAISTYFSGLATTFVMFLVIRAIAGIGQGAYYGPQYALSTEAIPASKRTIGNAIINSGMAFGTSGGYLLSSKAAKDGSTYVEDAGRGYRKVVPSPMPKEIVEKEAIRALVEADVLTICSGGGGIPVVAEDGQYVGVEAVNDKDFSARVLAENVDADRLIILTGVDNIYINYNQPDQKALEQISVAEAEEYIKEGHFAAGSMLPKIEAALDFVKGDDKRKAIITSIENLENIDKEAGTVISQKG